MGGESLPSSETAPKTAAEAKTLAPGFRFHPTDEELVSYFLKRKILNKPIHFDVIGEVDIYKHEPWDLAVFSKLKTRDKEWYFLSPSDNKKFGSGVRKHRLTTSGHWRSTGRDREIRSEIQLLGMRKTLVYHTGRAPDGVRTNWVMHEYRLVEHETDKDGNLQEVDAYVLCRVFQKSNIGPSDGKIYAAFDEDEWIDDDNGVAMIPGFRVSVEEQQPIANENNQMDQNHHENGLKLQVDNNNPDHDEEKEAPKRPKRSRRKNKFNNNSNKTTQDHLISSSSAAATNTELLEFSLMGTPNREASSPTPPPSTEEKIQEMSVERETFEIEMMEARVMINLLKFTIDQLRQENNELKEKNAKGG